MLDDEVDETDLLEADDELTETDVATLLDDKRDDSELLDKGGWLDELIDESVIALLVLLVLESLPPPQAVKLRTTTESQTIRWNLNLI